MSAARASTFTVTLVLLVMIAALWLALVHVIGPLAHERQRPVIATGSEQMSSLALAAALAEDRCQQTGPTYACEPPAR
jgi:hypothetical protein